MVHYGLPRTTNSVEAWHRSFATHIACHHPSKKKVQGLIEVKHAFYLTGREPPKRKVNVDRESTINSS